MWPVLVEGHQRARPWQVPLLWAGDLVALLLFVRFVLTHGTRGQPLLDKPLGRRPRWLQLQRTQEASFMPRLEAVF